MAILIQYHVEALSLQPMKQYIITTITMFDPRHFTVDSSPEFRLYYYYPLIYVLQCLRFSKKNQNAP